MGSREQWWLSELQGRRGMVGGAQLVCTEGGARGERAMETQMRWETRRDGGSGGIVSGGGSGGGGGCGDDAMASRLAVVSERRSHHRRRCHPPRRPLRRDCEARSGRRPFRICFDSSLPLSACASLALLRPSPVAARVAASPPLRLTQSPFQCSVEHSGCSPVDCRCRVSLGFCLSGCLVYWPPR